MSAARSHGSNAGTDDTSLIRASSPSYVTTNSEGKATELLLQDREGRQTSLSAGRRAGGRTVITLSARLLNGGHKLLPKQNNNNNNRKKKNGSI